MKNIFNDVSRQPKESHLNKLVCRIKILQEAYHFTQIAKDEPDSCIENLQMAQKKLDELH